MKETAYLLQAALVSAWWVALATNRNFFTAFQFDEIPPTAFWAFFVPDILLIAVASTIRAYRKLPNLEYIILGAFGYAALYCANASMLTASGYLPTGLMLLGFAYNGFICFSDSLFRVSTSSVYLNFVKTSIQVICIWILALIVVPYVILDAFDALVPPEQDAWLYVGIAIFTGCSALGLASAYYMVREGDGTPLPLDQTNKLVVSGPYHYVRNPMAIAGIGQGIGLSLIFHSVPIFLYSVLGAVVWHLVVRPIEERDMARRFGNSYLEYRQRVSCWIPTFHGRIT